MQNPFEEISQQLADINAKLDQAIEAKEEATPQLLSMSEASQFLGLTKATIYGKVSDRIIPFHKKGNRLWFDKDELIEWLKS